MKKTILLFPFCALALIFLISSCSEGIENLESEAARLEAELRITTECCAEITGPTVICTHPTASAVAFCANSCCEEAEYLWSGHPSIDGLTTRCVDASGLDESTTEIEVQVSCPIDDGDLPDIPGNPNENDYCVSNGTKSIKVCSEPTFSHPNPPLELQKVCYSAIRCFDFSNSTCFTNINVIDFDPGLLVSASGSELCIKTKLCAKTNPFVGSITLQFQGPCGDGEIVTWDNIQAGDKDCPKCVNKPISEDCDLVRCFCRTVKDCPKGFTCGEDGYCIKN